MDESTDSTRVNLMLAVMGITVFVLFCLIVLCARNCRSDEHDDDMLYGYSIDMIDGRDLLLRENLVDTELEDGASEWQCIVCIHMNHPDHDKCALCGASADASLLNGSLLNTNLTVLQTSGGGATMNNTSFLSDMALLHSTDIPLLRSSSGAAGGIVSSIDSVELATTVRQRALRYRRLNRMQLTQKQRGAHRRRLWQRVALPNGAFVWVRTAHTSPALQKSTSTTDASLLLKLRNNTFLTKHPQATALRGTVAEQLHRKNAATMGFFTELRDDGALTWRKTDSVIVQIDATSDAKSNSVEPADLDFEGLMSLSFREKKRWLLQRVSSITVPYMEALHRITIRRDHILQDSIVALGGYVPPKTLMQHLNITFVGEPALDAGGVLREWFGLVCKELFSAERGLFTTTHAENMSYWITPTPSHDGLDKDSDKASSVAETVDDDTDRLQYYTFAGRLIGKAILEGLVFEANLALPLLKHLLSVPITFSDLEFLDEELYRSAVWIRDNDSVDSLCLTFSVADTTGASDRVVELKPGGSDIDVTDENKLEYLALLLRYRMLGSVTEPLAALLAGLYEIIPKSVLSVFDYQELDFFLSGLPVLNVKDWQLHTRVLHFAKEDDVPGVEAEIQTVLWFWEAVEAFSDEERARLLQFATGSARVPVEGFKALTSASGYVHQFSLQLVPPGVPPLGLCPRAHTCFNRIDLPVYKTKDDLVTYLTLVRPLYGYACCCCFHDVWIVGLTMLVSMLLLFAGHSDGDHGLWL